MKYLLLILIALAFAIVACEQEVTKEMKDAGSDAAQKADVAAPALDAGKADAGSADAGDAPDKGK